MLEEANLAGRDQDPDSRYNSMFFELSAYLALGTKGLFQGRRPRPLFYNGANTTLTFANGTEVTFENKADVYDTTFISRNYKVVNGANFVRQGPHDTKDLAQRACPARPVRPDQRLPGGCNVHHRRSTGGFYLSAMGSMTWPSS